MAAPLGLGQIEQLWVQAGGDPNAAPLMARIAMAESGGNPSALNTNANTHDYSAGLWQINYFGNLSPDRTKRYGPVTSLYGNSRQAALNNARAAVSLYDHGKGLSAWKGDPAYEAYMSGHASSPLGVVQRLAGVSGGGSAGGGISPNPQQMMAEYLLQQAQAGMSGQNSVQAEGQGLLQMAMARKAAQASQASAPGTSSVQIGKGGPIIHGVNPSDPADLRAVELARNFIGTPYVWGGSHPGGFDCSGLVKYVWGQNGVNIPRTTYDQFQAGRAVSANALRPGDAVFFKGSDSIVRNGQVLPGHVGMYIGNGKFIEAPHTGSDVRISRLAGYPGFMGARRFG